MLGSLIKKTRRLQQSNGQHRSRLVAPVCVSVGLICGLLPMAAARAQLSSDIPAAPSTLAQSGNFPPLVRDQSATSAAGQTATFPGTQLTKNTGPCFFNDCLYAFEENYSYLAKPTPQTPRDWSDPLKYIPLDGSDDFYITFNGSFRPGYFHELNHVVSTPAGSTNESDNRLEAGIDLHLGPYVRAYADLYNGTYIGPSSTPPPVARNDLQTEDAFLEVSNDINNAGQTRFGVRLGRQQIWLGNGLLVSPSELANVPNTFDGVRGYFQNSNLRVDAFALESEVPAAGVEAGHPTSSSQLWGVYASYDAPKVQLGGAELKATVEPLYLGSRLANYSYDDGSLQLPPPPGPPGPPGPPAFVTGDDVRHTFGVRFYSSFAGFDTDATGTYQIGEFAGRNVSAWSVSSDTGYTLAMSWAPRLSFEANAASGGAKAGGAVHTYQPLFYNELYFADALNFAPTNFIDFGPHVLVKPLPGISIDLSNTWIYRQNKSDAIYNGLFSGLSDVNIYSPTADIPGRYVGDQVSLKLFAFLGRHISVLSVVTFFAPGQALRTLGGADTASILLLPTFKF